METPGYLVRDARSRRGQTIGQLSRLTCISSSVLDQIEADAFEEMGAEVFVKGHLRLVAVELQLDPERLIRAFQRTRRTDPVSEVRERAGTGFRDSLLAGLEMGWTSLRSAPLMVMGVIVVFAVSMVVFSLLAGQPATAEGQASFPESQESTWEMEKEVEQTRWLLEQPVNATDKNSQR
jgi:cytoskeletal protein RodZ